MNRFMITMMALAVTAVCISPLHAAAYRDPNGRFVVNLPSGWEQVIPDDTQTITLVVGNKKSAQLPYDAVCLGLYLAIAETRGKTQAEINSLVDGQITPEFWREALKSAGDKDFKINSSGNRDADGRKVHNVVFTGSAVENGVTTIAKGKMELHFVPGSLHTLLCISDEETYPVASAAFGPFLESYEPQADAVVASADAPAPALLTMFSDGGYAGVARVLSQDTQNLQSAGWVVSAASLAVDGVGAWQVCDGVNYSGTCQTVTGQMSNANGQPFSVQSARRVTGVGAEKSAAATTFRRGIAEYNLRRSLFQR